MWPRYLPFLALETGENPVRSRRCERRVFRWLKKATPLVMPGRLRKMLTLKSEYGIAAEVFCV
jgi:hypothetical protein